MTKGSQELMLGNMLIFRNIEILEHWLEMDSLDCNCLSVLSKDASDLIGLFWSNFQVLSSGHNGIFSGDWINGSSWSLLNTVGSEGAVDGVAEGLVVDEEIWVIGLIFVGEALELFSCEVEIQHRQNGLKLRLGDLASSEFIKIKEEFFNSDSFHDDGMLESQFNIKW